MATYEESQNRTYRITEENERILLANFTARITKETRVVDGLTTETHLTLEGLAHNPDAPQRPYVLHPIEIPASTFSSMSWVMTQWGVRAVMQPGHGVKDDMRANIQLASRPKETTIYKCMGWVGEGEGRMYLHAKGAITATGNDTAVQVRLQTELQKYDLASADEKRIKEAFEASLLLTQLAPKKMTWPLWCGIFTPLFGPVDFAIHVSGRSGTFKSELTSLVQSHYGSEMDARHLPGSWSSTPNALEAQAYYAANAIFTIDDFVPNGSSWQIRAYQNGADKLIRGQGNQAGRARLTDTSGMQTTFYPRGMILSTGEDTPEGHSVRARMMILEMTPGDVIPEELTKAQSLRKLLPTAVYTVIKQLCKSWVEITPRAHELRDKHIKIGHTRTPTMVGRLIATGEAVMDMMLNQRVITQKMRDSWVRELTACIIEVGTEQIKHLESADPIQLFWNGLRQALSGGHCHVRTLGGAIPMNPTALGWTSEKSSGAIETYKSHGPCIGWIKWDEDELYLESDTTFAMVKKMIGTELPLTKPTMYKRLRDAGMLKRSDDHRQRNTIRVSAEGHQRQCILVAASEALDQQEKQQEITE